jgi:hypothetical protein
MKDGRLYRSGVMTYNRRNSGWLSREDRLGDYLYCCEDILQRRYNVKKTDRIRLCVSLDPVKDAIRVDSMRVAWVIQFYFHKVGYPFLKRESVYWWVELV